MHYVDQRWTKKHDHCYMIWKQTKITFWPLITQQNTHSQQLYIKCALIQTHLLYVQGKRRIVPSAVCLTNIVNINRRHRPNIVIRFISFILWTNDEDCILGLLLTVWHNLTPRRTRLSTASQYKKSCSQAQHTHTHQHTRTIYWSEQTPHISFHQLMRRPNCIFWHAYKK